jgi:hypothetical protein
MLPEIAPQNSNRIPDGTTAGTNFRLSIPLTPPPGVRFSTGRVCAFCSDTITQKNCIKPQPNFTCCFEPEHFEWSEPFAEGFVGLCDLAAWSRDSGRHHCFGAQRAESWIRSSDIFSLRRDLCSAKCQTEGLKACTKRFCMRHMKRDNGMPVSVVPALAMHRWAPLPACVAVSLTKCLAAGQ